MSLGTDEGMGISNDSVATLTTIDRPRCDRPDPRRNGQGAAQCTRNAHATAVINPPASGSSRPQAWAWGWKNRIMAKENPRRHPEALQIHTFWGRQLAP